MISAKSSLDEQLERLTSAQLLRRADSNEESYSFKHALTQEAAYQSLLHRKQVEIHSRVAQAYERLYPDDLDDYAALLAYHYEKAGDDSKTIEYARRAADVAVRVHAYPEALNFYSKAIEVVERRGEPAAEMLRDLYTRTGRVRELSGQYAAARACYARMEAIARERGDRAMELAALMARTTIHAIPSTEYDFPLAQKLAARSLELARELKDRPAEAKILWNIMLMHSRFHMDARAAISAGEESIAIARALHLREQLAYSLNDIVILYLFDGQVERGEAALLESRSLWQEFGNLPMLTDNLSYAAMGHVVQGKFEQAITESQQAIELSLKIGSLWGEAFGRMWVGPAWLELGRPDRALATMQEALQLARPSGFIGPLGVAQADLGRLYGEFGEIERGVVLARRAFEMSPVPSSAPGTYSAGCLAFLLTRQGDLAGARQVITLVEQGLNPDSIKLRMTIELRLAEGELALAEHDNVRALDVFEQLVDTLVRLALKASLPLALLGKARALIGLGRVQDAESALEQARVEAVRLGARWSLWQILAALADVIESRDLNRAGELRREARGIVDDILSHTPDELRTSFLNTSAVKRLGSAR